MSLLGPLLYLGCAVLFGAEHGALHTRGAFNAGFVLSMGVHNVHNGPGLHKGASFTFIQLSEEVTHIVQNVRGGGREPARAMWQRLPLI